MRQGEGFKSLTRFLRGTQARLANALARLGDPLEIARLAKKKKAGPIAPPRCLVPFTRLEFLNRGIVTACCQAYTKVQAAGDIKKNTIEEIWNGPILQRMRRRILLGEIEKTCRPNCPFLLNAPLPIQDLPAETEQERLLKEDLEAARVELRAAPNYFTLANWGACNLRCAMCDSRSGEPLPAHVLKTQENLAHYFGQPVTLMLTGNGDPLARQDTRDLLLNFPADRYPDVRFEILTNGLLWTPEVWEQVKHCRFARVNVSVDAATRETYEKIRRGGNWDTLLEHLAIFSEAREDLLIQRLLVNMTVMRSNYREIPGFLELARRFRCYASFTPIRGDFGGENIFDPPDAAALKELSEIIHALSPAENSNLAQFAAQIRLRQE